MRYSKLAGQVLFLLSSGLLLGYTRRGKQRRELLAQCDHTWRSIDRNQLFYILHTLRLGGFIKKIEKNDETKIILTPKGIVRAPVHRLDNLKISKPNRWDGRWRMVIFDIPESRRKIRDALRWRLKNLGFKELQRSVFVFPYPCEDEINILINTYGLRREVRICETLLSFDADLKKAFNL